MSWIKNGTVNVTANSDIVTGSGTSFNASIKRGDILSLDGLDYEIDAVVNSVQLKLAKPFPGQTANGVAYGIVRTGAVVAELQENVSELVEYYALLLGVAAQGAATPELQALLQQVLAARDAAIAAKEAAELARDQAIAAAGGGGNSPAPSFSNQPTITPATGSVGTTYSAIPGVVLNGTISSRAWKLDGVLIGTGLSVTPSGAGALTYQETATGIGGTTLSVVRTATVGGSTGPAAPSYSVQPSISPQSGVIGTTFTASPGIVNNATNVTRVWMLNGVNIGTGLSVTPNATGSLTYQETATGAGGTTLSSLVVVSVSASGTAIDLTGDSPFYATASAVTPLGISVQGNPSSLSLSRSFTDAELKIRRQVDTVSYSPVSSAWRTINATGPFTPEGSAIASTMALTKKGSGTATTVAAAGGNPARIKLAKNAYLGSDALSLAFLTTNDITTTLTPPGLTIKWRGIVPEANNSVAILGSLNQYDIGNMEVKLRDWGQVIEVGYNRDKDYWIVESDIGENIKGSLRTVEVKWTNNFSGPGGTFTFYVDGVQYGAAKPAEHKLKISPGALFNVNASYDNPNDSVAGMEVEFAGIDIDKPVVSSVYNTISDGALTKADLENLVVDARDVSTDQPAKTLTYTINGVATALTIGVGEMVVPTGLAYEARLEDWSSGVGVEHPNRLVMTKPLAQRVTYEDPYMAAQQGMWTEVGPKSAGPILDGIAYGAFGIRQGNYVMFQFLYWLDRPSEPFGDPTGLETYMRPHKWKIYDKAGTLLKTIEMPNGQPLNSTSPIYEGPRDGRLAPMITDANRWYPNGTVRSSIIYSNGTPPVFSQANIWANVPVFDNRVPWASHTGYSVNGFDLRIGAGGNGGEGQMNGFANWKGIPWTWGSQTYDSIKTWASAANTKDPWKNYWASINVVPNAALWGKDDPFNTMGRCPVVGPGGTRDDRQIMAEPVARFARDISSKRAHDDLPMLDIALAYLRGYAADAFHSVEGGQIRPLFKGDMFRNIRSRGHYYGYGEATTPPEQAFYQMSGRLYETSTQTNPLRVPVPAKGKVANKPYFGTFELDDLHAHQFPGWGSMLFKSPEFAMLQISFADQAFMYENNILMTFDGPANFSDRRFAWKFAHMTLLWKTASKTSTRLYTQAECLERMVIDMEAFHDTWFVGDVSFTNPPSNIMNDGTVNPTAAVLAGARKFGPMYYTEREGLHTSEFQAGYWLSALYAAHKLGLLATLRAASSKCATIIDFLIELHRKHIVGRLNEAMEMNSEDGDYQIRPWTEDQIIAAGGNVANLPQTYAAAMAAQGNQKSPSWDVWKGLDGTIYNRDGQALDALLAGAAVLKDMGQTGSDLDAAEAKAEQLYQSKLASEAARGANLAGSEWGRYKQQTFDRPFKP